MVAIKSTLVGLIVTALATSIAADTCVVGSTFHRDISTGGGRIYVERGGKKLCDFDNKVDCGRNVVEKCKDLKHAVSFYTECSWGKFESCSVDYGNTERDGEPEQFSHASSCKVEFPC
ncbi:hypothetical protein N7492_005852 [Penicillium capsulatum]|uniref:Uncharacterized protein n=1 Tax=Penicillium capsulatum TaxID=69766 RepID=A0A9W9LRE4_9EURO|nr:hypothetical protein N7492_005852 [Penicillium capsulatum]KAJ6135048.1 hypothetical protein N7512_000208 [Penicillium capsulatum]